MLEGGCLCGGVRFRITGRLGPAGYCHCKMCQRASGSAFAANAPVRTPYFELRAGAELVTEYESSPGKFRAFCRACGSPIYSRRNSEPEIRRIRLGSLDSDPERRPLAHVWVSSKAAWHSIEDSLPQYDEGIAPDQQPRVSSSPDGGARVDSSSVGDPACFLALGELEGGLDALARAPAERGRVALIVRRGEAGRREIPDRVWLSSEAGVAGDAWGRRLERDPEMQIAAMEADVAKLIANGQPLTLFGDNLFLELDLSFANLPPGSRVRVGDALLEVTSMPHNGCRKFQARFGPDALRFVSREELGQRRLRGVYLRAVEPGEVRPGDSVEVLTRATEPA